MGAVNTVLAKEKRMRRVVMSEGVIFGDCLVVLIVIGYSLACLLILYIWRDGWQMVFRVWWARGDVDLVLEALGVSWLMDGVMAKIGWIM